MKRDIDTQFRSLEEHVPRDGSSVIAKTEFGKLIPCVYHNNEFVKVHIWEGVLEKFSLIASVAAWAYEIETEEGDWTPA